MFRNRLTILLTAVAILAIVTFGLFTYLNSKKYSDTNTPAMVLGTKNQTFAQAQAYQKQGNYSLAAQQYQNALPQVQDASQKSLINFRIAETSEYQGNYTQAIQRLKQIAADPANAGSIVRAYAVQEMGYMYYSNRYNMPVAQSITREIFSSIPYSALSASSTALSYRHLFEYATSFYPLGYSQVWIANWYANDLTVALKGATTTSQGAADISLITQSLQKANADVQRTQNDPRQSGAIQSVYSLEGVILGDLASVGAVNPNQAENYFNQALQWSKTAGNRAGNFTAYNYALFLANQYGVQRSKDIAQILLPFKKDNDANINSSMVDFFKTVRTSSAYVTQKNNVLMLAKLDPDFKIYLMSLGWHALDF